MINMQPQSDYESHLRLLKYNHMPKANISSILDVGGGDGSVWFNDTCKFRIDAIEPNPELAAEAIENGIYHNVYNDYSSLEKEVQDYDLITIMGVLEHISSPMELLKKFSNANKIYITVPNAHSFHRYVGYQLGLIKNLEELHPGDISIGHVRVFSPLTFGNLITKFCADFNFFESTWGTYGFKYTSSSEMKIVKDKWDGLDKASAQINISGPHTEFGAEMYSVLSK